MCLCVCCPTVTSCYKYRGGDGCTDLSILGLLRGGNEAMEMQADIMHSGFLAHWGKKSVLNLRVICIAYTTAQIDFQSVKHFSSAMCSAQLQ